MAEKQSKNLLEDSSASEKMRGWQHKSQLIKTLHSTLNAPHNLDFAGPMAKQAARVHHFLYSGGHNPLRNWAFFKNPSTGVEGVAVVLYSSTHPSHLVNYLYFDSNGQFKHASGADKFFNLLDSDAIVYIAKVNDTVLHYTSKLRRDPDLDVPIERKAYILAKKFRPLMMKFVQQAHADIQGRAIQIVKTGNYKKVDRRIQIMRLLERLLHSLEFPDEFTEDYLMDKLTDWTHWALLMTSHHYYPDEVGEIRSSYYHPANVYVNDGSTDTLSAINQTYNEIISGDLKKLSTLMYYVRQAILYHNPY